MKHNQSHTDISYKYEKNSVQYYSHSFNWNIFYQKKKLKSQLI